MQQVDRAVVELAESLAVRAHAGQMDQAGRPYIEHQERVAAAVRANPEAEAVAWLHETLEHTDLTPDLMRQYGIPENVVMAVITLTRWRSQSTAQYLQGVRANALALAVKIADMDDNTSPAQLERTDPQKRAKMVAQYLDYLVAFVGGPVSPSGATRPDRNHNASPAAPQATDAGNALAETGRARHRGADGDVEAGAVRDDQFGYRQGSPRQPTTPQYSQSLPGRTQLGGAHRGNQPTSPPPPENGHPTGLAHPDAYRHSARVPNAQQVQEHHGTGHRRPPHSGDNGARQEGTSRSELPSSRSATRRGSHSADGKPGQAAGHSGRQPEDSGYVGYGPQAAAARAYDYGDATGEAPITEHRRQPRQGRGHAR